MAEFMEHRIDKGTQIVPDTWTEGDSGFAAMGKPIPLYRRGAALTHLRSMGLDNTEQAMSCIGRMSEHLERGDPFKAMSVGMEYVDLTGTCIIMAELLTAEKPRVRVKAGTCGT